MCIRDRNGTGALAMPPSACLADVAAALSARSESARVLRIAALDLRRLCPWMGSAQAALDFNRAASSALHHTVRFCAQEELDPPPASAGDSCSWGYRPPRALPSSEAAARAYQAARPSADVTSFTEPRACRQEPAGALEYTCS